MSEKIDELIEGLSRASVDREISSEPFQKILANFDAARAALRAAYDEQAARIVLLESLLQDPESMRANILMGHIKIPDDLVWFYDTNGPVSELRARIDELEQYKIEQAKIKQERADFLRQAIGTPSLEHLVVRWKELTARCTKLEQALRSLVAYIDAGDWRSNSLDKIMRTARAALDKTPSDST